MCIRDSQCCGLSVNGSVHYNPEGPAKFDVKELEEAEFVLRSDMTVIPVSSSFLGYNNCLLYTSGMEQYIIWMTIEELEDQLYILKFANAKQNTAYNLFVSSIFM